MKKLISLILIFAVFAMTLSAQGFYGKTVIIDEPVMQYAAEDDKWIAGSLWGQLPGIFQRYSAKTGIILKSRQNIDRVKREQHIQETVGDKEFDVAKLLNGDYLILINIIKKRNSYSVDCQMTDVATGNSVGPSYVNQNCSVDFIDTGLVNEIAYTLLSGMGCSQSDLASLKNSGSQDKTVIAANENLAKAIQIETKTGSAAAAVPYYEKASQSSQTDGESEWRLGNAYYDGKGVAQSYDKAFEWYKKSAEKGNPNGQFYLGLCYELGLGTKKDNRLASAWYERAANQNDAYAQYAMYSIGKGKEWLQKAADNGLSYALAKLGDEYYFKDKNKASEYYEKAALQEHTRAQVELASLYYFKFKNYEKALYWYEKAAQSGDSEGQQGLGMCYERMNDYEKAISWYKKASEQGDGFAASYLGRVYENHYKDFEKAFYWYKKATEYEPVKMEELGRCYEKGIGVSINKQKAIDCYTAAVIAGGNINFLERISNTAGIAEYKTAYEIEDSEKSFKWYFKSAEKGFIPAQIKVAEYYDHKENYKVAVTWYKKLAEQNVPIGLYELGYHYFFGQGVSENVNLGIEYIQKAANHNYVSAYDFLGKIYFEGRKVAKDYNKAFQYLKKGSAYSSHILARCYDFGLGTQKNEGIAIKYYKKAAEVNNKDAVKELKRRGIWM